MAGLGKPSIEHHDRKESGSVPSFRYQNLTGSVLS